MKTGVKVLDAMTREPISISPDKNIEECAKLMLKKGVGGIVIVDGNKIKGIITEKDLVERVIAKNLDPKKVKVSDIMSKKIIGIKPDIDIYDALIKMRDSNVRRLPVIHDDRLVGLLTEKDILKIEPSLFDLIVEKMEVAEETGKPVFVKGLKIGKCENCGYEARLFGINGRNLCNMCKEL